VPAAATAADASSTPRADGTAAAATDSGVPAASDTTVTPVSTTAATSEGLLPIDDRGEVPDAIAAGDASANDVDATPTEAIAITGNTTAVAANATSMVPGAAAAANATDPIRANRTAAAAAVLATLGANATDASDAAARGKAVDKNGAGLVTTLTEDDITGSERIKISSATSARAKGIAERASVGVIVGAVLGSVAAVGLVACCVVVVRRHIARNKYERFAEI
jgi:hypothetical protein